MPKLLTIIIAAIALSTLPAAARHCPKDAQAIDAAITKIKLADADKTKVLELKKQGLELHNAGKHADAEGVLAEAMRILLTNVK
jgi:hypothetical protein